MNNRLGKNEGYTMKCYFQGCSKEGTTKEHIPPKSFFPKNQRNQLITVKSCEIHNNKKSVDDIYTLAHICLNSSPKNRAREVFINSISPQLEYNKNKLRRILVRDSKQLLNGKVIYKVNQSRLDSFFDALCCGLMYNEVKKQIPETYSIHHIYHNLIYKSLTDDDADFIKNMEKLYETNTLKTLSFGKTEFKNISIYKAKFFGIMNYKSSITIVHLFFGYFKVTSMLHKQIE